MTKPRMNARELDAWHQSAFSDVSGIIVPVRRSVARPVNAVMTAARWLMGRRIVAFERFHTCLRKPIRWKQSSVMQE